MVHIGLDDLLKAINETSPKIEEEDPPMGHSLPQALATMPSSNKDSKESEVDKSFNKRNQDFQQGFNPSHTLQTVDETLTRSENSSAATDELYEKPLSSESPLNISDKKQKDEPSFDTQEHHAKVIKLHPEMEVKESLSYSSDRIEDLAFDQKLDIKEENIRGISGQKSPLFFVEQEKRESLLSESG